MRSPPRAEVKNLKNRESDFVPEAIWSPRGTSPSRDQKMIKNPRKRILRQKSKIFAENNVPEPLSIFASKIENSQERCFSAHFRKNGIKTTHAKIFAERKFLGISCHFYQKCLKNRHFGKNPAHESGPIPDPCLKPDQSLVKIRSKWPEFIKALTKLRPSGSWRIFPKIQDSTTLDFEKLLSRGTLGP